MATTLAAAQDRLRQVIASALPGVPVHVGWPPGNPNWEHVWISGDVDDWERRWPVTMTQTSAVVDERYTLRVNITTSTSSDAYSVLRDRLIALATAVDNAIRADVTLAGTVSFARVERIGLNEAADRETGRRGVATLDVVCQGQA